jgi:hypothetical protein
MKNPEAVLMSALEKAKHPREQFSAMRDYYAACDANAAGFVSAYALKLGCNSGCAHCCHQRVTSVPHEVFVICDFVEEHFSETERSALIGRLEQYIATIREMSVEQRDSTSIACPFLVRDRCSVYPVRPFPCRTAHAEHSAECQAFWARHVDAPAPTAYRPLHELWFDMGGGCEACHRVAGFEVYEVDLPTFAFAALTEESHLRAWWRKQ